VRSNAPTPLVAIRRADTMSRDDANAGAVAFSRHGSPDLGEFEDAVIFKTFCDVPEDFARMDQS
jgi:hypothetical protein